MLSPNLLNHTRNREGDTHAHDRLTILFPELSGSHSFLVIEIIHQRAERGKPETMKYDVTDRCD